MTCEDCQESLYLYAAGALPDDEAAGLRGHLAGGCPLCAGVLAEATAAAALLTRTLTPVAPPRSVKERLMRRIESDAVRAATFDGPHAINGPPARRPARGPAWLAAAAIVALAALAGLQYQVGKNRAANNAVAVNNLKTELKDALGQRALAEMQARSAAAAASERAATLTTDLVAARTQAEAAELALSRRQTELNQARADLAASRSELAAATDAAARVAAAAEATVKQLETAYAEAKTAADRAVASAAFATAPGLRLIEMGAADPKAPPSKARGRVFLDTAGNLNVFVADLAPPGAGKVFELWVIPPAAKPVPVGTFNVEANGTGTIVAKLPQGVTTFDAAAISIEPTGGSPQPTGPIPLIGKVGG